MEKPGRSLSALLMNTKHTSAIEESVRTLRLDNGRVRSSSSSMALKLIVFGNKVSAFNLSINPSICTFAIHLKQPHAVTSYTGTSYFEQLKMHLSIRSLRSSCLFISFALALAVPMSGVSGELLRIPNPDEQLHIYALPVGDGESTVLQCPGGDLVVVDMGSRGRGWSAERVSSFLEHQLDRVRSVVVSNTSPEHYNYLAGVLGDRSSQLELVVLGGREEYYQGDAGFSAWLKTHEKMVRYVNSGEPCITDCDISAIACGEEGSEVQLKLLGANLAQNQSNAGIILQVSSQEFRLLLPGDFAGHDMEELVLYEWSVLGYSLASSHYKLSRHGAANKANGEKFLTAVSPSYAFSSNGYPDSYDSWNPSCDIVWRLLNLQCIHKSKYIGSFACGNSQTRSPMQYNNWPYEIHSTSADQHLGRLLRINVNTTDTKNARTPPEVFYSVLGSV